MDKKVLELKKDIENMADQNRKELEDISSYIHENPELSFEEYKAQEILCDYLEKNEFKIEKGIGGLETSFEGIYDTGIAGKKIAFLAEYDALPDVGHGCGHNLIGTSAVGAGVILKEIIKENNIPGMIKVIGTPAEENGSGKITMVDKGVFKGLDAALIMHPSDASMPDDISFAAATIEYNFKGVSAHAAAFPWKGSSALNGVIQLFNNINALRLHTKDYSRIHGIITDGGSAHNTIPEKATALFNIRALDFEYLMELIKQINNCAKGVALSTNTTVEISQKGEIIKDIRNDKDLVGIVRNNMSFIKEEFIERDLTQGIGSTDVGNVTHEIPAIQFYIKLKDNIGTHTIEFEKYSGNEYGKRTLNSAVKVLAMSGLDVLLK
ncbi:MAG: M20 family metallopeptidase [Tissierellaceae bacterium]